MRHTRDSLPSNQRLDGSLLLSLPVRNERGESRREGPSRGITPPLPGPLLPPASGREGEAGSPGGYGAQSAHKVRGVLSWGRGRGEGGPNFPLTFNHVVQISGERCNSRFWLLRRKPNDDFIA